MSNIVAIVGRPNVGKSTLFNRLIEERKAIVDQVSGVTRDRHYGESVWNGKYFTVIDTGGYVNNSDDIFEEEIKKQVELAIDEADVILFLVDVTESITPMDEDVITMLRKCVKPVLLVVNKVDNSERFNDAYSFYETGFDKIFPIAAISGSGTGELLNEVISHLSDDTESIMEDIPKIAIVGRPNVGKSTLINCLLGVERHIVTPIAGTTRDSNYTRYNAFGFDFYLIDTAGLRKKKRVHEDLEFYSVMRSIRAIEDADVCVLMLDAQTSIEEQDLNIFSLIQRNNKGVVIMVNKWDLVEKETNTQLLIEREMKERLSPFKDVPFFFVSALNKQRIIKAFESVVQVFENRKQRIKTSELNEKLLPVLLKNPPPIYKGKEIKIKYITQLPIHYPAFVFFCNLPQYVKDPYKRYVENRMREMYNFKGVPIKIYFRKK
ncbi:MAG: ribosome biogenesis GTPase Der [Bacteroidales bacterium]|nr:ribosome biogenesis GTPase Der [Bacteroidales bacterium]